MDEFQTIMAFVLSTGYMITVAIAIYAILKVMNQ